MRYRVSTLGEILLWRRRSGEEVGTGKRKRRKGA